MFSIYKKEHRNDLYKLLCDYLKCFHCFQIIQSKKFSPMGIICTDCIKKLFLKDRKTDQHTLYKCLIDVIKPNKDFLKDLIKSLECPICYLQIFSTNYPYLKLCQNGHGVCLTCSQFSPDCPLCRSDYKGYGMILKRLELMASILKYNQPCINAKYGCTYKNAYYLLPEHEFDCRFSSFICTIDSCSWTGEENFLGKHGLKYHSKKIISNSNNFLLKNLEDDVPSIQMLNFDANLYILVYCKLDEGLVIILKNINKSYSSKKATITLTINKNNHTFYLPIIISNASILTNIKNDPNRLVIPYSMISHNYDNLKCSIQFKPTLIKKINHIIFIMGLLLNTAYYIKLKFI